jgi:hypothetical protein
VHINQDPFLLSPLPTSFEGGFDIFIPALTSQRNADPTINGLGVSGQRIVIPEQAGIWRNS